MSDLGPAKLAKKLADVMAAVERVPKTGHNNFHNYDYATEADIVAAIRGELSKRAVILLPAVLSGQRTAVGEKGEWLTELSMQFTFIDGESGEMVTCPWHGAGSDKLDKGAYKAMTGGEKYFLLKTFLVPTGDDPEEDGQQTQRRNTASTAQVAPRPAAAPPSARPAATPATTGQRPAPAAQPQGGGFRVISEPQQKRAFAIARDKGWTGDQVKALLTQKFSVDSVAKISVGRYNEFCSLLQSGVGSPEVNAR